MKAPVWLSSVEPIDPAILLPVMPGSELLAWHATVRFKHWTPPPGVEMPSRAETYGKTLIVSSDGGWTVAEIELVRRLRSKSWQAGWVDSFGQAPKTMGEWILDPDSFPPQLREAYEAIILATGRKRGGSPDIIAWQGQSLSSAVFIEYKGPNDRVRPSQQAWVQSALNQGIVRDQFAVVRWPKSPVRNY